MYSLKRYLLDADMSLCTEIFYTLACLRSGTGEGRQAERCSFSDTSDTESGGDDATWVDDAVWYDSIWMDDDNEQSMELSYGSQVGRLSGPLVGRGKDSF